MLGVAGVLRAMPMAAQSLAAGPTPAERERLAHLAADWALETEPLRCEPGYRYAYSNFGYCLLGRVIEKITNQKYDQYIISALLGPSGISDMQKQYT